MWQGSRNKENIYVERNCTSSLLNTAWSSWDSLNEYKPLAAFIIYLHCWLYLQKLCTLHWARQQVHDGNPLFNPLEIPSLSESHSNPAASSSMKYRFESQMSLFILKDITVKPTDYYYCYLSGLQNPPTQDLGQMLCYVLC